MSETQQTINDWQRETFPTADEAGVLNHIREEFAEFLAEPCGEEAADVVILIMAWARYRKIDVMAEINRKMAINRARRWNIQADGTGRHQ